MKELDVSDTESVVEQDDIGVVVEQRGNAELLPVGN